MQRLNVKLLSILLAVIVVLTIGVAVVHAIQMNRHVDGLVVRAKAIRDTEPFTAFDLLARYRAYHPDDLENGTEYAMLAADIARANHNTGYYKAANDSLIQLMHGFENRLPEYRKVMDKLIAANFGNLAMDALLAGKSGVMAALVEGSYALAAIPDPTLGPRKVDVATMYNTDRYRPNYANKLGLPIFLTRA
jgi:hypothetical protein